MMADESFDLESLGSDEIFEGVNLDELEQQAQTQVQAQSSQVVVPSEKQKQNLNLPNSYTNSSQKVRESTVNSQASLSSNDLRTELLIKSGENAILRANLLKQSEANNAALESLNNSIKQKQDEYQRKLEELKKEIEYAKTKSLFHEREAQDAIETMKKNEKRCKRNSPIMKKSHEEDGDNKLLSSSDQLAKSTKHAAKNSPSKKKRKTSVATAEDASTDSVSSSIAISDASLSLSLMKDLLSLQKREDLYFSSRTLAYVFGGCMHSLETIEGEEEGECLFNNLKALIYSPDLSMDSSNYVQSVVQTSSSILNYSMKKLLYNASFAITSLFNALLILDPKSSTFIFQENVVSLISGFLLKEYEKSNFLDSKFYVLIDFLYLYLSIARESADDFANITKAVDPSLFESCIRVQNAPSLIKCGVCLIISSTTPSFCASVNLLNADDKSQESLMQLFTTMAHILVVTTRERINFPELNEWITLHRFVISFFTVFIQMSGNIGKEILKVCNPLIVCIGLAITWYHQQLLSSMYPQNECVEILVSLVRLLYILSSEDLSSKFMLAENALQPRFVYAIACCAFGDTEQKAFGNLGEEMYFLTTELLEVCVSPEELEQLYTNF
nr:rad26 [Schizosaccharomyces pombe]